MTGVWGAMQRAIKGRNRINPAATPMAQAQVAGGTDATSVLQTAAVSNFTISNLTPQGTGVATFEFRQLQPTAVPAADAVVRKPPARLPPLKNRTKSGESLDRRDEAVESSAAGRSRAPTASSISGGDHKPADTGKIVLKSFLHGTRRCCISLAVVMVVTIIGNAVFSVLEADNETDSRASYKEDMLKFKARTNLSDADFDWIVAKIGTDIEFDPDGSTRNWGTWNTNSALFSFTIVSTIGYGNFAPETEGGKIFLIAYALIGIPIIGTAVGILAGQVRAAPCSLLPTERAHMLACEIKPNGDTRGKQVLSALEFMAVMRMKELEEAFRHFDTDDSGFLVRPKAT